MPDIKPTRVVKRIKKVATGHRGGAGKIAYADFVTAMMAFFLLMWLLGSTSKGHLEGIADYFKTPLKVALAGGSGSGDSVSVKGGGTDLTRQAGQVKQGEIEPDKKNDKLQAARTEFERLETKKLQALKRTLETLIDQNPMLRQFKRQLLIDITTEGLRIQIVDELNRPMFNAASADLPRYHRRVLRAIGQALNGVEQRISLAAHTDAMPYAGDGQGHGNWELSTERANASRRELVAGGMDESRVLRVVGLADAIPLDVNDPLNPGNRRISIIVLNKRTEVAITENPVAATLEPAKSARQRAPPGAAAAMRG